jgi:AcrR family transcriptional regulator
MGNQRVAIALYFAVEDDMAAQSRRERLRTELTGEIIVAARMLLERDGPGAVSVRGIARQIGLSAPAIYRYFPSHDSLMDALNESVTTEMCATVESAGHQPSDVARAFRGWTLAHPASFRFALGLNGQRSLIARLLRHSTPPKSTPPTSAPPKSTPPTSTPVSAPPSAPMSALSLAALCGLALLELSCDPKDLPPDIAHLYEAAAGLAG